jgi:hypothetical protein
VVDGFHEPVEQLVGDAGHLDLGEHELAALAPGHHPGTGHRLDPVGHDHVEVDHTELLIGHNAQ